MSKSISSLNLVLCVLIVISSSTQNFIDLAVADVHKDREIALFEEKLVSGNVLDYLSIKGVIEEYSFEELDALSKPLSVSQTAPLLSSLIQKNITERMEQSIFLLKEDIFINNTPRTNNETFYANEKNYRINDLNAEVEYLYFPNLKLTYQKNDLFEQNPSWFVSPHPNQTFGVLTNIEGNKKKLEVNLSSKIDPVRYASHWSYVYPPRMRTNFLYSFRQWIKKYQEPQRVVKAYEDTLLFRDEYRVYCIEKKTGVLRWSFALNDPQQKDSYQTLYHPHQNEESYEFEVVQDTLFTEINGSIISLALDPWKKPVLRWEYPLGAYTLCAQPMVAASQVIVGIINARGEIWILSLDTDSGKEKWSTYVGMSSFLSPVSTLSAADESSAYIGLNHGVLISINTDSGRIEWIKKYSPKQYSLIDYWDKEYYKTNYVGEGKIPFDNQFLTIDNGKIYYKARESNYVYLLNQKTGAIVKELFVPYTEYRAIGMINSILVLAQLNNAHDAKSFVFIDRDFDQEIAHFDLPVSGPVMGAVSGSKQTLAVKIGKEGYRFALKDNRIQYQRMETVGDEAQWLIGMNNRDFIVSNEIALNYFSEEKGGSDGAITIDDSNTHYLKEVNSIISQLDDAVQAHDPDDEELKNIGNRLQAQHIPFELIEPAIVEMIQKRQNHALTHFDVFLTDIADTYSNVNIHYYGVSLMLRHLLLSIGLIQDETAQNRPNNQALIDKTPINVRGEKIYLQPLTVIKGEQETDFFLMLNNDQFLCVEESGLIRWQTKIFYQTHLPMIGIKNRPRGLIGHLYGDDIKAYLFEDILIVNDRINVIALNINTGKHIWSLTNKGTEFGTEKIASTINESPYFAKYGISPSFVENCMYHTQFFNDNLFIVHRNRVIKMNPRTGIVQSKTELENAGVIELHAGRNNLFALSLNGRYASIINPEDLTIKTVALPSDEQQVLRAQGAVIDDTFLIDSGKVLLSVNAQDKNVKTVLPLGNDDNRHIESYKDMLLIVTPFKHIRAFRLNQNVLKEEWAFLFPYQEHTVFKVPPKEYVLKSSTYYFTINNHIIFPVMDNWKFSLIALDIRTGKTSWKTKPLEIEGFFYHMSNANISKGLLSFILSTAYLGNSDDALDPDTTVAKCLSSFIQIGLKNGNVETEMKLPSISGFRRGFDKTSTLRTKDRLLYGLYGLHIHSKEETQ